MQLEVGKIVEGKVTGITKFGAFVELESGEVGMVHISEVAPTYVNDIADHLTDNQKVTVKVLTIGEDGKISLSIKKAMKNPLPRRDNQGREFSKPDFNRSGNGSRPAGGGPRPAGNRPGGFQRPANNGGNRGGYSKAPSKTGGTFEDMLSKFMQSSDEKISGIKKTREVSRRGGQKRPPTK